MSSPWQTELIHAGGLAAACLILLAIAETWARLGKPEPEWPRKLVHIGGGLICLAFPFLLQSAWTVLAIALPMTALFALGAKADFLHSLHNVKRRTRGSEYYPIAIFLLYLIGRAWPHLYVTSVLTLAFADAGAALIGTRRGRHRYEVEDETKSLEGSLVFLLIAWLVIALPSLAMTDLPVPVVLLGALYVAILVTGFEAISLSGTDNLFVPLGVCIILHKILDKPLAEIIWQTSALLGTAVAVLAITWKCKAFNAGATIGLTLFVYGAWGLCDGRWALPAFAGLTTFVVAWYGWPLPGHDRIRLRLISRVLLIPFLVIVMANAMQAYDLWLPIYTTACVLVVALAFQIHLVRARGMSTMWIGLGTGLVTSLLLASPLLLAGELSLVVWLGTLVLASSACSWDAVRYRSAPIAAIDQSWTARHVLLSSTATGLMALWVLM